MSLSHVQELAPCFFFLSFPLIPLRCAASELTILGLVVVGAGVKDVVLEANAKDEVEVTGTMDIPNMVSYLTTGSKLLAHDIRDGLKH